MWKKLDKDIAARKILDIIEYLQESGFSPNKIRFLYKEETSVAFSEWNNINDVSQISKLLE
jgi:methylphosphotriester-DNA--protein-cysteine methyltransferase